MNAIIDCIDKNIMCGKDLEYLRYEMFINNSESLLRQSQSKMGAESGGRLLTPKHGKR